jgi:predicted DNA-binding helix-hairpin-helix protein
MIIGATADTDYQILNLTEGLYKNYKLKRVFFSAYTPVSEDSLLPAPDTKPQLWREHRLYQADWLLRYYDFSAGELLDQQHQNFNPYLDPKCTWALNNLHFFPVDVNRAPYRDLLRVPGIGVTGAKRIIAARRTRALRFEGLKHLGVVLKRAQFFITCSGKTADGIKIAEHSMLRSLLSEKALEQYRFNFSLEQLALFDRPPLLENPGRSCENECSGGLKLLL